MSSVLSNFWNKSRVVAGDAPSRGATPVEFPRAANAPAPVVKIATMEQLGRWTRVLTSVAGEIGLSSADRECVVAIEREDGGVHLLFVPKPGYLQALAAIEGRLKEQGLRQVQRFESTPAILAILYDAADMSKRGISDVGETESGKIFDGILTAALRREASDIHIQQAGMVTYVRFRVHGDLMLHNTLPASTGERLGRAIFAAASDDTKGVDWNPKQFQDAKISRDLIVDGRKFQLQLRFANMPAYPEGWTVTLRVLGHRKEVQTIEGLGYNKDQIAAFHRMLRKPTGAVFMCGPTGSGKSTTLAALTELLDRRNQGRKLLRTIEDPPEAILAGAIQTAVVRGEDGRGNDFARALKAAMRGDPDSLLVGEVRDEETARLSMEAVMTGHLLLSTVHAASPFDAVERLIDKGFKRETMSADDILAGVVYQRLIPLLCPHCSLTFAEAIRAGTLAHDHVARVRRYFPGNPEDARYRGPGCAHCDEGLKGRTTAASMLLPDRELRAMIRDGDRVMAQAYWRSNKWSDGMEVNGRTALEQGIEKMSCGLVSPLDVEITLGDIDSEESRESTLEWLGRNHSVMAVRA